MMKIGIITFHRAYNYGAVLQAFALNRIIKDMGHRCDIIDYRCKKIEEVTSPFAGFKERTNIIKALIQMIFRTKKIIEFDAFMKKNISLSPKCYTKDNIAETANEYECFFTGSDQVWNYDCTEGDETFFLDFVDLGKKKNSYAASFGFEKRPESDVFDYNNLLSNFNTISVRESSGKKLVKELAAKDSNVVLDPTLLLTAKQWKELVAERPIDKDYIFVYYIREPKDLLAYAQKLAKETGCVVIDAKKSLDFFKKCSPTDFLAWIYYAKYFVTNSFHGTVFSLLFKKKFVVELDNGKSVNNRSKELLDLVKVDRELSLERIEDIDIETDYSIGEKILAEQRDASIGFIRSAISAVE